MSSATDFPTELVTVVKDFQTGITNVEKVLKPLMEVPLSQLQVKPWLSSSKARWIARNLGLKLLLVLESEMHLGLEILLPTAQVVLNGPMCSQASHRRMVSVSNHFLKITGTYQSNQEY